MISLLLFQGLNVPLWVAIVTVVGGILSPIVATIVTWLLARPKQRLEITEQRQKLQKSSLENFDFENEAFAHAKTIIDRLSKENLDLSEKNLQQERDINILQREKGKLEGKVELSLEERDGIAEDLKKISKEHTECLEHQKIIDGKVEILETENKSLNDRLNVIVGILRKNNVECPEEYKWIMELPNGSKE